MNDFHNCVNRFWGAMVFEGADSHLYYERLFQGSCLGDRSSIYNANKAAFFVYTC